MRNVARAMTIGVATMVLAACGGDVQERDMDVGPLVDSTPAAEGDTHPAPMTSDTPTTAGSMGGTGATAGDDSRGTPADSAALPASPPP